MDRREADVRGGEGRGEDWKKNVQAVLILIALKRAPKLKHPREIHVKLSRLLRCLYFSRLILKVIEGLLPISLNFRY